MERINKLVKINERQIVLDKLLSLSNDTFNSLISDMNEQELAKLDYILNETISKDEENDIIWLHGYVDILEMRLDKWQSIDKNVNPKIAKLAEGIKIINFKGGE